jgi:hypothetical protein
MNAVRSGEYALAPRAQQVALCIEHRDRVFTTVERVYPVLAVHPDRRDIAQQDLIRQFCPSIAHGKRVLAASELYRHASSPKYISDKDHRTAPLLRASEDWSCTLHNPDNR